MTLDPCPWCGEPPNVQHWEEYDSSTFRDYKMVRVWCCWADMTTLEEDVELNWNWRVSDNK